MRQVTLALCLGFLFSHAALSATLRVGPHERITRIAEAARIARDGDVVEIQPGFYTGDVAVWRQKRLTIVGLGDGPVLEANGQIAEGKAIWVIANGHFRISNISFRNARAPDRNGAGIRFERGHLEIINCRFANNQMGLLTANFPSAVLNIRDSLFTDAPPQEDVLPHLLYIGRIAQATITGSRFQHGHAGHLIKSRARRTELRYNLIHDGPSGTASYEVDLPEGGDATLIGNIIGQSAGTRNPTVVSYGAEGGHWPVNRLRLSHNTLINEHWPAAWFLRVWSDRVHGAEVIAINNLTVGPGTLTLTNTGTFSGNYPALSSMLESPQTLDFRLTDPSLLAGLVDTAGSIDASLVPTAEFNFPLGTRSIPARSTWSPGALQPR